MSGVIVTAPPYADYLAEVARHPAVTGFRLNTVMPLKEAPVVVLERMAGLGKPLWVDLKGRQLRVVGAALPPFTEVRVSHPLRVETPVTAFFHDGLEAVRVMAVDGDRLILEDGPRRMVGPGESVNIPHPSLEIEGTLTDTDRTYLEAMKTLGLKQVMLSYVETPQDAAEVREILPDAELVLKIESQRGLAYARRWGNAHGRLMAARGDLYVEVPRPHLIIRALKEIIRADPQAIAASRLFESLVHVAVPNCADIGDAAFLLSAGYRTLMLGDLTCLRRDVLLETLNLAQAVMDQFL